MDHISSNGYSEPKSWESQAVDNNESWNHDEVPIPTSAAKWDNDEEPAVYGQHDIDVSNYDDDTRETDFDSKGYGNFNQNEEETFQKDDLVEVLMEAMMVKIHFETTRCNGNLNVIGFCSYIVHDNF